MRRMIPSILLILLNTLAACVTPIKLARTPQQFLLYEFTKHKVNVTVVLESSDDDLSRLLVRFAPIDPTLHLYSKDLPADGIDGIGRPTTFSILSGSFVAEGNLLADVEEYKQNFPGIDKTFPLYPDGAVTLTQIVKHNKTSSDNEITMVITYMACSSEGYCFPPVKENITVIIPEEFN